MPILKQQIGSTAQSSKTDQKTARLNMGAIELMSRYGISIKPPTPYSIRRIVKDEPLVEVTEILGEDPIETLKSLFYFANRNNFKMSFVNINEFFQYDFIIFSNYPQDKKFVLF